MKLKHEKCILIGEKMSPLVSVIIPSYNHEKFLKERIDSVLNQTFQDFELIILMIYLLTIAERLLKVIGSS